MLNLFLGQKCSIRFGYERRHWEHLESEMFASYLRSVDRSRLVSGMPKKKVSGKESKWYCRVRHGPCFQLCSTLIWCRCGQFVQGTKCNELEDYSSSRNTRLVDFSEAGCTHLIEINKRRVKIAELLRDKSIVVGKKKDGRGSKTNHFVDTGPAIFMKTLWKILDPLLTYANLIAAMMFLLVELHVRRRH